MRWVYTALTGVVLCGSEVNSQAPYQPGRPSEWQSSSGYVGPQVKLPDTDSDSFYYRSSSDSDSGSLDYYYVSVDEDEDSTAQAIDVPKNGAKDGNEYYYLSSSDSGSGSDSGSYDYYYYLYTSSSDDDGDAGFPSASTVAATGATTNVASGTASGTTSAVTGEGYYYVSASGSASGSPYAVEEDDTADTYEYYGNDAQPQNDQIRYPVTYIPRPPSPGDLVAPFNEAGESPIPIPQGAVGFDPVSTIPTSYTPVPMEGASGRQDGDGGVRAAGSDVPDEAAAIPVTATDAASDQNSERAQEKLEGEAPTVLSALQGGSASGQQQAEEVSWGVVVGIAVAGAVLLGGTAATVVVLLRRRRANSSQLKGTSQASAAKHTGADSASTERHATQGGSDISSGQKYTSTNMHVPAVVVHGV